jgi:hypothetical protein
MIMRWISEVPSKMVKLSGMALADLRMTTIMHLAWQESMIVDCYLPPFSRLSRNSDGTDAPSGQQH